MAKHSGKFVCYYRVSTDKQGKSGLGFEAQRDAVASYLNGGKWQIVAEFTEIESGKRADNRPKLAEAFKACRLHKATLVIAKLDRLSRNVHFLTGLEKAGVDFVCADMPDANKMTVRLMAVIAEGESDMISDRTKRSMAMAKKQGRQFGGIRYKFQRDEHGEIVKDADGRPIRTGEIAKGSAETIAAANEVKQAKISQFAADLAPIIRGLQKAGISSANGIAASLNDQGITTRAGGKWQAVQVQRILQRIEG